MNPGDPLKNLESIFRIATVVLLAASFAGCGNKQSASDSGNNAPVNHSSGKPVDAATAGSVTGTVHFDGVVPQMKIINMIDVPNCAKLHSTPVMTESVVPGDNGTLQNVVVYLQGDFSAYSFPPAAAPVQVDQDGCIYTPHVVAVMTGDPLEVTNKDAVTHNINAMSQFHQGWNETQVRGGPPIERRFSREEIPMTVKCNMHTWMRFYLAVVNHPYFQVTGKDGQFGLRNVPPGTYTLTAWHETFGIKKQTITIQPKQEQTVSITFTDKDRP
jgi:plastocyanin